MVHIGNKPSQGEPVLPRPGRASIPNIKSWSQYHVAYRELVTTKATDEG
jgi:hypothetical protein